MLLVDLPVEVLPDLTLFCFADFMSKRTNLEVKSYDLIVALQRSLFLLRTDPWTRSLPRSCPILLFPATSQCQKLKGTHWDSRGWRGQLSANPSVKIRFVAFLSVKLREIILPTVNINCNTESHPATQLCVFSKSVNVIIPFDYNLTDKYVLNC